MIAVFGPPTGARTPRCGLATAGTAAGRDGNRRPRRAWGNAGGPVGIVADGPMPDAPGGRGGARGTRHNTGWTPPLGREYGSPAVAATGDATHRPRTGQLVTVDGSVGAVEPAGDPAQAPFQQHPARAEEPL